jgi:hypothetical protein
MLTAPLAGVAFQQTELMAERADVELLERLRSTLRWLRALWWARRKGSARSSQALQASCGHRGRAA